MNRMGVFIFYDEQGIVDKYVEVLLQSIRNILDKLVIIINGKINEEDYNKLLSYSHTIYIRENIGYDAGGYKDAFTKLITDEDLKRWDEVVLFNDTFYGPLYPWKELFDEMEGTETDFWGLSRHYGKQITGDVIPSHIQSFFLTCRKALITSEAWRDFWSCLEYPRSVQEAIWNFEISFSVFFSEKGFRSKALTDNVGIEYVGNPYSRHLQELIRDVHFPVIKRKVISFGNFKNMKNIFNYICDNTEYDVNLICSNIRRLQMEGRHNIFSPFKEREIECFYNTHERIYIYGHGNYGQGMSSYFEYKGWKYEGFLVTKKDEDDNKDSNVFTYNNVSFNERDGIILALGKRAFDTVYPMIKKRIKITQLLIPQIE